MNTMNIIKWLLIATLPLIILAVIIFRKHAVRGARAGSQAVTSMFRNTGTKTWVTIMSVAAILLLGWLFWPDSAKKEPRTVASEEPRYGKQGRYKGAWRHVDTSFTLVGSFPLTIGNDEIFTCTPSARCSVWVDDRWYIDGPGMKNDFAGAHHYIFKSLGTSGVTLTLRFAPATLHAQK